MIREVVEDALVLTQEGTRRRIPQRRLSLSDHSQVINALLATRVFSRTTCPEQERRSDLGVTRPDPN